MKRYRIGSFRRNRRKLSSVQPIHASRTESRVRLDFEPTDSRV